MSNYGDEARSPRSSPSAPILLGNMWAQSWGNIYDLVAPGDADPGFDLTDPAWSDNGYDAKKMVETGEDVLLPRIGL